MTKYFRDPADDGSSPQSDVVSYPLDDMRQAAAKILVDADLALTKHNTQWYSIKKFVERFPGFMQGTIFNVLNPYEKRLRDSYQWQMDFATALFDTADQMENTDQTVSDNFQPTGFDDGHGHQVM
ncbi:hypothetical protein [Tengunoibacter tsumagoiensis]|uniref:Uncharacterized protein n=1 Tax=Tengunoibacter tsumagoiensis TaxID=2014871 RepID=A0A401ZUE1_9CHLR|nr:hypothetical protein [Tengunoibacter tsumagoiensis]GCE10535.1 hypothetical protein KTT_03940 [Tengunoibacter tsumagoiensis]